MPTLVSRSFAIVALLLFASLSSVSAVGVFKDRRAVSGKRMTSEEKAAKFCAHIEQSGGNGVPAEIVDACDNDDFDAVKQLTKGDYDGVQSRAVLEHFCSQPADVHAAFAAECAAAPAGVKRACQKLTTVCDGGRDGDGQLRKKVERNDRKAANRAARLVQEYLEAIEDANAGDGVTGGPSTADKKKGKRSRAQLDKHCSALTSGKSASSDGVLGKINALKLNAADHVTTLDLASSLDEYMECRCSGDSGLCTLEAQNFARAVQPFVRKVLPKTKDGLRRAPPSTGTQTKTFVETESSTSSGAGASSRIKTLRNQVLNGNSANSQALVVAGSRALAKWDPGYSVKIGFTAFKLLMDGAELIQEGATGGAFSCAPGLDYSQDQGYCVSFGCTALWVAQFSCQLCAPPVSVGGSVAICVPFVSDIISITASLPLVGEFIGGLLANLGIDPGSGCVRLANLNVDFYAMRIAVDLDFYWSPAIVRFHPNLRFALNFPMGGRASGSIHIGVTVAVINWAFWEWGWRYWLDIASINTGIGF